ncbi:MAG: class I SAM-dependent methyltransferase, partial [Alphaproteobacteria bacterium]
MSTKKDARQLEAAKGLASELAAKLNLNASLRLWDGTLTPLGDNVTGPFVLSIAGPGVIGSLLRRPTLDNFIRHYVDKGIDFSGGTIVDLGSQLNRGGRSVKLKGREALKLATKLVPFLLARGDDALEDQGFEGEITGRSRKITDNKDFIQFHYDLSNEFYALFLDPEMVYSCAYYTDWQN